MVLSSRTRVSEFKSSPYERCRQLLHSRNAQAARACRKDAERREAQEAASALEKELRRAREQLQQAQRRIHRLEVENARLKQEPLRLPDDPPLPKHSYGAKLISLCVNLSQVVGLRAVEKVLQIVADWLGQELPIPQWTSVRRWLCRMGVASLEEPLEAAEDWIWMADHSNQLGKEKVLAILGIRARDLPEPGQPLRHQDMRCLALVPGAQWKQEDVAAQYDVLAERLGAPLAVLADGASELRESVAVLQKPGKKVIQLGDLKHHAANVLKKALDQDSRFDSFLRELGCTRSAIQQTELAHFTPPPQKQKARFMNLAPTLRWAEMVLWHLKHRDSRACQGIAAERLEQKLGWLESFRTEIARWSRCQRVISETLTWINEQGVYAGAARQLQAYLHEHQLGGCSESDAVLRNLVEFVNAAESRLEPGMRLPLSTEILESSFGRYKVLEKQHSKGGFTSLLAAFPALLRHCTPEGVCEAFTRVPVAALKAWTTKNLGSTLAAKRKLAYKDFAASTS